MKTTNSFNPYQDSLYTSPLSIGAYGTRPADLLEHCQVFGQTGAGKTRCFVVPAIESVLQHFGQGSAEKACGLIIDAKADMAGFIKQVAERTGRVEDLRILTENGSCWFDLFAQFEGRPEAVGAFLFDMLDEDRQSSGTNDVFWDQNARRLLSAAVTLAKAVHGNTFGGLDGIRDSLKILTELKGGSIDDDEPDSAPGELNGILQQLENGLIANHIDGFSAQQLIDYCRGDILNNAPRTWGIIANYARGFLAHFADERLVELFRPDDSKVCIRPERVIDEGLIFVVSLSPLLYQGMEEPFLRAIKQAFCGRILMRNSLVDYSRKPHHLINQSRPILLVMDEFHTTLTPRGNGNEAFFLDRAREFRCMCFLATQGMSAIYARMRDPAAAQHLLNNSGTKVFFRTSCSHTLNYFQQLLGTEKREVESCLLEAKTAPPRFRLPNHEFIPHSQWQARSMQMDHRSEPAMDVSTLRRLPDGVAIVIDKSAEPTKVKFSRFEDSRN